MSKHSSSLKSSSDTVPISSTETDFFKDYPQTPTSQALPTDAQTPDNQSPMPSFVLGDQTGEDSIEDEESAPAILIPEAPLTNGNGLEEDMIGGPPADDDEPECAAVTEWRSEFAKRLETKVLNERNIKNERKEKAEETLNNLYKRWDRKRNDAFDDNKKQQQEMIRERDAVISRMSKKGEQPNWDIVPQLADLSGTFKEGARDTSRMRQVLLRMKT